MGKRSRTGPRGHAGWRGDGFPPQLRSLSEQAPSKCGACKREVYSYNMSEVISDFG